MTTQFGARSAIFFPLAVLGLLAFVTFWVDKAVQPQEPRIDGSSRHDPDYIMHNFETTQTDINGALRYKLAAVEMKHYPDDDSTDLVKPRYTQYALDKPYTRVEGDVGQVSSDGEQVDLQGNVKVTRQAFAGKEEMTVETDYLEIRPNDEYVSTERPVVIKQAPKTVIYATGMVYDKKKQTVTLLHKVRAHYERPAAGARPTKAKVSNRKVKKPPNGKQ
ncbi:MAG: LPS export ABC transporter periplasmic protein LptC [Betaproteobacteria bacterium HGW-Betaproteobacteria-22]|nr:MAG: LPS export ABC transporter periplasmic protein LptC [Betaproteobacteria bacterium HGW-Betaproteobacteria-22]